ncbi:flagellin N-terminal helical domain-containing protein [Sulfurospirillum sp. 1612]|uniref:flagellin N-terminal helical domain-containing protein n=1 Tax=Sulfurospirillum sp. 1612 TaxID=3094835 RepID=UPI002F928019
MRITNSLFYLNTVANYQNSMKNLYDVNNQISSGTKIQDSYQDSGIYSETMRLDSELSTLQQVQDSSSKAQTFANNTDASMNQMTDALTQFKTKLIKAASSVNSTTSLNAIANDLQSLRDSMVSIANTSINGQFLFSGSALNVKPISTDGTYNGNGNDLNAVIGSEVKLPYNIDGQSLFLGKDSDYSKIVSTNVKMYNQTTEANSAEQVALQSSDSIQDMVGGDATTNGTPVFYLSGRKPDGETFNTKFEVSTTSKVSDLLDKIGTAYGNTTDNEIVNVSMNDYGQIEVKDLQKGNTLLQMNLFGAIDRSAGAGNTGGADQNDIDNLSSQPNVEIISFLKSNFSSSDTALSDASNYSIRGFEKDGDQLSANVSQFVKSTGDYATASTKLSDVAGSASLDGKQFLLTGTNINGTSFNVQVDLSSTGSTFSLDGGTTNYTLFDANGNATPADEVTYQQLNDVVSMVTSNTLPTSNTATDYNTAVASAQQSVSVTLDNQGKMQIKDNNNSASKIDFTMYDSDANNFDGTTAPAMTFMANDAITVDEPNVSMFQQLDAMIAAVREGNFTMDSTASDPRNTGIQNAMLQLDHISDHVDKMHTKIGTYSNALQSANERASFLSLNVTKVKSSIADVDIAEAYMNFTQISNNYQAMLSTVAKINSMSLLNYM